MGGEQTFDDIDRAARALEAMVSGVEVGTLSGAGATRLVERLVVTERVLAAVRAQAAARAADANQWRHAGERSPAAWLANLTGTTTGQAASELATTKRLAELPATAAARAAGRLSESQARAVAEAATADPGAEAELLAHAARDDAAALARRCAAVKAAAERDEVAARARMRRSRRFRWWNDADGAFCFAGRGLPEHGAALLAAMKPYQDRAFHAARRRGEREATEAYAYDALMDLTGATGERGGSTGSTGGDAAPGAADDGAGSDRGGHTSGDTMRAGATGERGRRTVGAAAPGPGAPGPGATADDGAPSDRGGHTPGDTMRAGATGERGRGTAGGDAATAPGAAGDRATDRRPASDRDGDTGGATRPGERDDDVWRVPSSHVAARPPTSTGTVDGEAPETRVPPEATLFDAADGPRPATAPGDEASADTDADENTGSSPGIGAPTKVIVRIDHAALVRGCTVPGEVCEIVGHGPVPVATARELARDAFLAAVVVDGVDVTTVAHLGRAATAHQRSALEARGMHCAVPGCGTTTRLEIDHVEGWALTRRTHVDELDWLCHFHHGQKTHRSYRLAGPPGRRTWHPPGDEPPNTS